MFAKFHVFFFNELSNCQKIEFETFGVDMLKGFSHVYSNTIKTL